MLRVEGRRRMVRPRSIREDCEKIDLAGVGAEWKRE